MKRLILLLLFLPTLTFAQGKGITMHGAGSGAGAAPAVVYCTGATTCTATNPGNCELMCEDGLGASECDSDSNPDLDAVCRNGYAATVGAGDTLDFTTAANGTRLCNDTKTNGVIQIACDDGTATYFNFDTGGNRDDSWTQMYFNIVSEAIGNSQNFDLMRIGDSSNNLSLRVMVYQSSGLLYLRLQYRKSDASDAYSGVAATAISTGTWYRLQVNIDKSGGTTGVYLNGVEQFALTDVHTTERIPRNWRFGNPSGGSAAVTMQLENLAVSATGPQGACQ